MSGTSTITLDHVTKRYGGVTAVSDLTLEIEQGGVFGLLGPNGAGKTTTVEMMEGLRSPDQGTVRVLGQDPCGSDSKVKERIGVQLQIGAFYDKLRVQELLDLFGAFYPRRLDTGSLLKRFSLEQKRKAPYHTLSGGLKQRVALALALVNDPTILFLDELSTGLDPHARRELWENVTQLAAEGRTILLTTHYMEEAEVLCNRVGVLNQGRLVAVGEPKALIAEARVSNLEEFFLTMTKEEPQC